jgi:Na+-driven multidrug efflux pump
LIFFVDSTLFSGVLIMVGRHDIQGMAALALIFEWVALAVMIPVGLSEAIVQRVAQAQSQFELGDKADSLPAALRIILRAAYLVTSLYLLIVSVVFIGFDINIPTLFIVDNEAHPALIERLDRYALLGLLVAVFMSFIIVFAAILRGMLDVRTSMIAVVVCYWGIGLGVTFVLVEMLGGGADEALHTVTIALGVGTATLVARLWVLIGRSTPAPVSG